MINKSKPRWGSLRKARVKGLVGVFACLQKGTRKTTRGVSHTSDLKEQKGCRGETSSKVRDSNREKPNCVGRSKPKKTSIKKEVGGGWSLGVIGLRGLGEQGERLAKVFWGGWKWRKTFLFGGILGWPRKHMRLKPRTWQKKGDIQSEKAVMEKKRTGIVNGYRRQPISRGQASK